MDITYVATVALGQAKRSADRAVNAYRAERGDDQRDDALINLTSLVVLSALLLDDPFEAPADHAVIALLALRMAITHEPTLSASDLIDYAAEVYYN